MLEGLDLQRRLLMLLLLATLVSAQPTVRPGAQECGAVETACKQSLAMDAASANGGFVRPLELIGKDRCHCYALVSRVCQAQAFREGLETWPDSYHRDVE